VFKRAWQIKKKYDGNPSNEGKALFGECLRLAWAEIGTEAWVGTEEASRITGYCVRNLRYMASGGKLLSFYRDGKLFFHREAINLLADECTIDMSSYVGADKYASDNGIPERTIRYWLKNNLKPELEGVKYKNKWYVKKDVRKSISSSEEDKNAQKLRALIFGGRACAASA
jgi:hypothetical protein